ncbi:MAG: hypothetical protein QM599_00270 [Pseudoxanthomonas sp.]
MSEPQADVHVMGVIALELSGGDAPGRDALGPAEAGALAEKLARDLAELAPAARTLELAFAAAHFDPAEVLRPGWPLHRRLDELAARAPGRNEHIPRLIAFGADAQGEAPLPFRADAHLRGGALRVLPFLLRGDAVTVAKVSAQLEEILLERGMAQADTALLAQSGFAARIEHARYLTVHDLAAMMAMQYRHQGLDALWSLVETALLRPQDEQWLDAPPEPLLHLGDGEARMALLTPLAWQRRYAPQSAEADRERLARAYDRFLARQRQLAAVLEAHGIAVVFAHCADGADARMALVS